MAGESVNTSPVAADDASLRPAAGRAHRRRWAVVACLVLAALLRLVDVGRQSLWIDEVMSLESAAQPIEALALESDGHPPLYHVLLKTSGWLSSSEMRGRVLSGVFGVATVGVLILVGDAMFGAGTGVLAGFLLAISPLHVWYSREGRMYALAVLFAVVTSSCLVRAVERGRARDWVAYGLATVGALASHYFSGPLALAQGLFVLIDGPARRRGFWPLAAVAAGVLAVGVLAWPILRADRTVDWTWRTFDRAAVPYTALVFLGGFGLGPSTRELHAVSRWASVAAHAWELAAVVTLEFVVALAAVRGLRRAGRWGRYVALWLFVPPACVFGASALTGIAYNVRLVLVSLPAFMLLVALGLRRLPRAAATATLAALLVVSAASIARDRLDVRYAREDTRAAGAYLTRQVPAGGRVAVVADTPIAVQWYTRGPRTVELVHGLPIETAAAAERAVRQLAAAGPTWCVFTRAWDQDPDGLLAAALDRATGGPVATFTGVKIYKVG